MFLRIGSRVRNRRTWRSQTAILATIVVAASVVSTGPAVAARPGTADIVVHAGGTVTGSDGSAPIAVTSGWNGTSNKVIVTNRALPAAGTDTYTIVVNATVPVDAAAAELPCTDAVSGEGFGNTATATSGRDEFTADACGPIPALTAPSITKTVSANVQNADRSWTVTYDLAVANPHATLATEYDLSDVLAYGNGITIDSATVTGPAGAATNPGWNGVDDVAIVTHRVIGAATTEHYTVTVNARVGTTATVTDRDCTVLTGEDSTGFLNGATLTLGSRGSTSTACAAPGSPTMPTSPNPDVPLAYTGVQVWQLIWMAIALLIGGVALLILIGRRRPAAGDVR